MIICVTLFAFNLFLGTTGLLYSQVRSNVDEGFSLIGPHEITVLYGNQYDDEGFNVNLFANNNPYVLVSNSVDTSKLGNYEVTYTLNYLNYHKSLVRKVSVIDNVAPEITLDCEDDINLVVNTKFEGCTYKVKDNYDEDKDIRVDINSNLDETKIGDYTITWIATDTSGNTSEKKVTIHVKNRNDLYYIIVTITKQQLDYYENGKLYLTTPVTTGYYNKTPKGNFKILNKARNATLKGANYSSFVKYWMAFRSGGYGIHDASWRNNFGNMNYYYNGSHGCINTPLEAMKTLYERVEVGTPVYVKD